MEFEEGLKIHKKLFPRATARTQLLKLNEELQELENVETTKEFKEELGDVLVVAMSLLRFPDGKCVGNFILDRLYYKQTIKEQKKRFRCYKKALEKCKQRVAEERYKFIKGLYKRDKC